MLLAFYVLITGDRGSKMRAFGIGLGFLVFFSGDVFARNPGPRSTALCYLHGAEGLKVGFSKELLKTFSDLPGTNVVIFDLGKKGDIASRARRFQQKLELELSKKPDFQCHLMAYSMGGVVARYAFSKLALQNDVAWDSTVLSLTTLASPHRGTPIADLIWEFFPNLMGRGLESLSERALKNVNNESHDDYWAQPEIPTFSYRSYIAERDEAYTFVYKFGHEFIQKDARRRGLDPRSDGLVPYRSQAIGEVLADIRVPHSYFTDLLPDYYPSSGFDLIRMQWDCLEGESSSEREDFLSSYYFEASESFLSFCGGTSRRDRKVHLGNRVL